MALTRQGAPVVFSGTTNGMGVKAGIGVLALVATLYPSWRASRINPAQALRYE